MDDYAPRYAQNYTRIYPFSEYGDYYFSFIKMGYLVPNRVFQSRLGQTITNPLAANGKPVFECFPSYPTAVCINEEVGEMSNGWQTVTEIYADAPVNKYTHRDAFGSEIGEPFIFRKSGQMSYSFPRQTWILNSGAAAYVRTGTTSAPAGNSFDAQTDTLNIQLTTTEIDVKAHLPLGSLVRLYASGAVSNSQNYYYDLESADTTVVGYSSWIENGETRGGVVLKAVSMTFNNAAPNSSAAGVSISGDILTTFLNSLQIYIFGNPAWRGQIFVQRREEEIPSKSLTVTSEDRVAYFTDFSVAEAFANVNARFKILSAAKGGEVDYVGYDTTPTRYEYNQKVSNGVKISAQDPQIEQVYQKLWKVTAKYIIPQ